MILVKVSTLLAYSQCRFPKGISKAKQHGVVGFEVGDLLLTLCARCAVVLRSGRLLFSDYVQKRHIKIYLFNKKYRIFLLLGTKKEKITARASRNRIKHVVC